MRSAPSCRGALAPENPPQTILQLAKTLGETSSNTTPIASVFHYFYKLTWVLQGGGVEEWTALLSHGAG